MGQLLKPRGLKGELRAAIFNSTTMALKVGVDIWLKTKEEEFFSREIEKIKIAGEKSCIKLTGCDKREDAESIQGLHIFLPRNAFEPLGEDEYYLVDLIGSHVIDENRESIGSVLDVLSMPGQNLIVVKAGEREILIPYVDAHILLFDEKEKILIVKDVQGLVN